MNCEGRPTEVLFYKNLHFRFIDVPEIVEFEVWDLNKEEKECLEWLRKFANFVSNRDNDVYNEASKFADKETK